MDLFAQLYNKFSKLFVGLLNESSWNSKLETNGETKYAWGLKNDPKAAFIISKSIGWQEFSFFFKLI
jgi:hypothetical protein